MHRSFSIARLLFLLALLGVFFTPLVHAEVVELDNRGLQKLLDAGVTIVDIRRPDEWRQTGIVPGSRLVTFFHDKEYKVFDIRAWLAAFDEVAQKGRPVILICRTGNRTQAVSKLASQQGYSTVYNVTGGIAGWIKAGNPVTAWQEGPAEAVRE